MPPLNFSPDVELKYAHHISAVSIPMSTNAALPFIVSRSK
jgi:hypothetical protein